MKDTSRLFPLACLGLLLMAANPAIAKGKAAATSGPREETPPSASEMVDISAEQSLEWYKDKRLYVARGKAKAIHGAMIVEADILTAHQRESLPSNGEQKKNDPSAPQGMGNIDQMTAEGNVHIHDDKQQVFGDKAVYDLDQKTITVTGSNLKYITETDIVTARDSLEYYEDKKMAIARGRAVGEHQDNRVEADVLSAQFGDSPTGQMEMKKMYGKGNVLITTKDGGLSRGDNAVYDVKKNVAVLTRHVRITRGETELAGDQAEVDFATGQSRLINSGSGRVRALLPTSSQKKSDQPATKGAK